MNITRIAKLNSLITNNLKRKPIIIMDRNPEKQIRIYGSGNDVSLSIDTDIWMITDEIKEFIKQLNLTDYSIEEKIIKIYEKLCQDYTYDDNVLTYIKKNDDDTFFLPDYYGRDTDDSWKEKRKEHNRRSCFEISRVLAKALIEMLTTSGHYNDYDICILWDEAVTHYFVGLICEKYSLSLDLDDFTQIKDLTRLKTELSIAGIKILEDNENVFGNVLEEYNKDKSKVAKDHIQKKFEGKENDDENDDEIEFLKFSVQILKEEYNLDSAGIYEFIKEIVDTKIGTKSRRKAWKEVENISEGTGKRYTRCLLVTIHDTEYIIDVTKEDINEIVRIYNAKDEKVILFKDMDRNWNDDPYDGR